MDIQVSSNLERLLFEMNGRDGAALGAQLDDFRATGSFQLDSALRASLVDGWAGARFVDDAVRACIADEADRSGILLDPHTAVGLLAARACRRDSSIPMVALATAHPAKFPDAVEAATGVRPELPDHLADLYERPERLTELPADLAVIEDFVRAHRR